MTVKQLINDYEFMDFHIGIYIENIPVIIGLPNDIMQYATGYVLNSKVECYIANMIGELKVYINLRGKSK